MVVVANLGSWCRGGGSGGSGHGGAKFVWLFLIGLWLVSMPGLD